jgi:hypothetical protein
MTQMKKIIKLLSILIPTTIFSLDSIFFRVGYGGNWQFYTSEYTGYPFIPEKSSNIVPADVLSVGSDMKITQNHGFSISYEQGFLFPGNLLRYGSASYKWYPLSWYNELFLGAGAGYLTMELNNLNTVKRLAGHISYGLNIQFPANIFIVVEFKNLFSVDVSAQTATNSRIIINHNLLLTASISYKVSLIGSKSASP